MKHCPTCNRVEADDALAFCRTDGTRLIGDSANSDTLILSSTASIQSKELPTQHFDGKPSIAVLPFANMSADPENEHFCDGLAEELINALAKVVDLKVAARTSAFFFKGKNTNVREIRQALNVQSILEGSVRKVGNRLRITAQLVNADGGYHLWSERYDRKMKDIFEIQDEITLAVVDALKVRLLGKVKSTEPPTSDTGAYELYLKGRNLLYQRGLSIPKAIECFRQAVSLDPNYAHAWAGLAEIHDLGLLRIRKGCRSDASRARGRAPVFGIGSCTRGGAQRTGLRHALVGSQL